MVIEAAQAGWRYRWLRARLSGRCEGGQEGPGRVMSSARLGAEPFVGARRRHVFDKLRAIDLVLAEFQELLGRGEVIAEAEDNPAELREIVLVVEWSRPLHVVVVVDSARQEERLVTVYEPDPSLWTADYRRRR